jgi:hypothetical protein
MRVTAACSPPLGGTIARRRCGAGRSARSRRGPAPIFHSPGKAGRRSPGWMRVANPANESSRPAHRTVPARAWRGRGSVHRAPERACALRHHLTGLRTGAAWSAETMRASPLPRPASGSRALAQPVLRRSGARMRPDPSSRLISHRLRRAAETSHPRLHSAASLRPRATAGSSKRPVSSRPLLHRVSALQNCRTCLCTVASPHEAVRSEFQWMSTARVCAEPIGPELFAGSEPPRSHDNLRRGRAVL